MTKPKHLIAPTRKYRGKQLPTHEDCALAVKRFLRAGGQIVHLGSEVRIQPPIRYGHGNWKWDNLPEEAMQLHTIEEKED